VTAFLQQEDFSKALAKLRPAQRPASWQTRFEKKIQQILAEPYQPKPSHSIQLESGRQLAVPSVEDRIIQGAIHHAISRHARPTEIQGTHAMGREVLHQLERLRTCWVLRCDIKDFFPSLEHHAAFSALSSACPEMDLWTRQAVKAILASSPRGLPQGSPLSPLLAELALANVDQELQKVQGIRYVDDFVIFTKSFEEAELQTAALAQLIAPLGLRLNADKTTISRYPDTGFTFLGEQYPRPPEQAVLVAAPTGSVGLGLPPFAGETPTCTTITEGGSSRQVTPSGLQLSKEYFLRNLTDKPTLDAILVLASTQPQCPSTWGQKLYEERDKFLSTRMAKPLHDAAFKLYVGKVKPKQAEANPADGARVLQALIIGNEILKTGRFPKSFNGMSTPYQEAMEGLHAGNYEQYRKVVSELFKQNYPLRKNNPLPSISEYEKSVIDQDFDPLEEENINIA
jgi:hypothetical protein